MARQPLLTTTTVNAGRVMLNDMTAELYAFASDTISAGWEEFSAGATIEARIALADAACVSQGKSLLHIPLSMIPYDITLCPATAGVRRFREGGSPDVYDVQAYGAAGDDVTDDSAAVSAANAAATAAGGGDVFFPEPPNLSYRLTGSFTISAPTTWTARPGTLLRWLDNPVPAIILNNSPPPGGIPSTQRYGWGMRGMRLQPLVARNGTAIQFSSATDNLAIGVVCDTVDVVAWNIGHQFGGALCTFVNCRILDCTQDIVANGSPNTGGERVVYMGCAFSQGLANYANNCEISQNFSDFHFIGCSFDSSQLLVSSDSTTTVTCTDCHFENVGGGGADLPQAKLTGGATLQIIAGLFSQNIASPTMLGFVEQTAGRLIIDGGLCNHAGGGTALAAFVRQTGGVCEFASLPERRNTTALITTSGVAAGAVVSAYHVMISSPGALAAGNNNDYTLIEPAGTYRLAPNAANSVITGFAMAGGNLPGRRARIVHISGNGGTITLAHNDANSSVGNRLLCATGASIVLAQHGIADVEYDATNTSWRVR